MIALSLAFSAACIEAPENFESDEFALVDERGPISDPECDRIKQEYQDLLVKLLPYTNCRMTLCRNAVANIRLEMSFLAEEFYTRFCKGWHPGTGPFAPQKSRT